MQITAKRTPTATQPRVTVGPNHSASASEAHAYSSTSAENRKAPGADARAILRGELIWRGSRHVASLRGGVLRRNLDIARETYKGAILFHHDVLRIARANGARLIVCTDRETGQEYSVTMDSYALNAWRYVHPRYGSQWALDLRHWERVPAPGEAVQLSLLAGLR